MTFGKPLLNTEYYVSLFDTFSSTQTGFVEVLSITGQRLFTVPLNTGDNLVLLDLSGYSQGVYMFRIFVNDEFTEAGRIIRND